MKKIGIIGGSGTIGKQSIQIIESKQNMFNLCSFAVGTNIKYGIMIANKHNIKILGIKNEKDLKYVKLKVKCKVVWGEKGLIEVATYKEIEVLITAIVGFLGLMPTIEAINAKKDIALANKETLVCAGHIIMPLAKEKNINIIPIDSEHSAIFQCLNGENKKDLKKIILTASGGSFRDKTINELKNVTPEQALDHPNWNMGPKITIDSSTMFNKALEIIEAKWLFNLRPNQIEVLIHRQSIIHSMVEFNDKGYIAQLGIPSMLLPIQYALTFPNRLDIPELSELKLSEVKNLSFEEINNEFFPAIKLAYKVMELGGLAPTILNAANEELVKLFLDNKIKYLDIALIIDLALKKLENQQNPTIDEIITSDKITRSWVLKNYKK